MHIEGFQVERKRLADQIADTLMNMIGNGTFNNNGISNANSSFKFNGNFKIHRPNYSISNDKGKNNRA